MNSFFSNRNQVYPVLRDGQAAVEKHFTDMTDWQWEAALYAVLEGRLPLPTVLDSAPGVLVTAYEPAPTLLEELQRQEAGRFSPEPWERLADWIIDCHAICGRLPSEGSLRNFLWSESDGRVVGLDLENYREDAVSACGTRFAAWLRNYSPKGTSVKAEAAELLIRRLYVAEEALVQGEASLLARRDGLRTAPVSGVILAGGRSSRMGQDKARLPLFGRTLLEWQVRKMQALGIQEIIVSGAAAPEGARQVEDIYPARGPLGGLHACLREARNSFCLVLGVDIPLVPPSALRHLLQTPRRGVTVLSHKGLQEPLAGVYDRELADTIQALIENGSAPVQALKNYTEWNTFDYQGPEAFLRNCNRPEDYIAVCRTAVAYDRANLPLL